MNIINLIYNSLFFKLIITDLLILYFFRYYNAYKTKDLEDLYGKINLLLAAILNLGWLSWIFANIISNTININNKIIYTIVLLIGAFCIYRYPNKTIKQKKYS